MPTGDNLAEPIVAATIKAEVEDEKKAVAAALQTVPRESMADHRLDRDDGDDDWNDPDWPAPTVEELTTLRRVPHHIPIHLLGIGFVELCERFSYYGCVVVRKSDHAQAQARSASLYGDKRLTCTINQ
jgi:POT family proton-dependent oligopeptide transporter